MTEQTEQPLWRKSRFCGSAACVEVARVADRYLIRNSTNPDVQVEFTLEEWDAFVLGLKEDKFE